MEIFKSFKTWKFSRDENYSHPQRKNQDKTNKPKKKKKKQKKQIKTKTNLCDKATPTTQSK